MKPGSNVQITLRPLPGSTSAMGGEARPSRLLTAIYRDIGMAAVADGLDLAPEALDPAAHEAVKRGYRYIDLLPRRRAEAASAE